MRTTTLVLVCTLLLTLTRGLQLRNISFPNDPHGRWEGFGVSLCWWANVFGADRTDILLAAFSLDDDVDVLLYNGDSVTTTRVPGLGFNIARYNVGASSSKVSLPNGTAMVKSPNMPSWKEMEGFWLTPQQWDLESRDLRQKAVVDYILVNNNNKSYSQHDDERSVTSRLNNMTVDSIEIFSNSPIWWQCCNDNPSGSATGWTNNLNPLYMQAHAHYMVKVTAYFAFNLSWPVRSLELFNEPSADWWKADGTQEGCRIGPHEQMSVLAFLPEQLDLHALQGEVRVAASDESFVDMALATWLTFDDATKTLVNQVNVHGYEEGGNRSGLYQEVVLNSGKVLRDSEYGDGDGTGQQLIRSIMTDWHYLHPLGWCYWQVVDFAAGWGLFLGSMASSSKDGHVVGPWNASITAVNTKFYVVAQLSRHIRPHMQVVVPEDILFDDQNAAPLSVAAVDDVNETLVLVVANLGNDTQWIAIDLAMIVFFDTVDSVYVKRFDTNGQMYRKSTPLMLNSHLKSSTAAVMPP